MKIFSDIKRVSKSLSSDETYVDGYFDIYVNIDFEDEDLYNEKEANLLFNNIYKSLNKMGTFREEGYNNDGALGGSIILVKDKKLREFILDKFEDYEEPLSTSSGTFWNFFDENAIYKGVDNSEIYDLSVDFYN